MVRDTLPAPGFLQTQRCSSRKSPSITPNLAPVSPGVHWLPSRRTELSLGRPGWGTLWDHLPSWYLSTAKVRNRAPTSWRKCREDGGARPGVWGAVWGRAVSFCSWPLLLTSLSHLLLPRGPELGQLHCQVWLHLSPARPQEPHSEARQQPLSIPGEPRP